MLDSNWKNWVLVLAVLVGFSFEVIKHIPGSETADLWKSENFHIANIVPYSIQHLLKSHPSKLPTTPLMKPVHVAANNVDVDNVLKKFIAENTPAQTELDKKKAKKKKDDDEYEEVIDPETGKKVRRKKKKDESKDEKKDDKATDVAAIDPNQLQNTPPANADDIPAAVAAAAAAAAADGAGLPAGQGAPANSFKTLAEWEALLLSQPSLTETQAFIQAYKDNLVTASVFYTVAKAMLADSRTDMKQLGELCAGDTPSVTSFEMLADLEKTQNTGTLGTQANKFLSGYSASLGDLSILQSVLRSSDTYAATVAAQELDASAKKFLTQAAGGNPTTTSTAPANAAHFIPFINILQSLTTSPDTTLDSQAQQTLTDLRGLLGSAATQPTATASTQFERDLETR